MRKASYWLGWSDDHRNTERLLQVQPKERMTSPAAYEAGWLFACVFSCPPARARQVQSADSIALARVRHVIQPHALSPYTRASVVRWLLSRVSGSSNAGEGATDEDEHPERKRDREWKVIHLCHLFPSA